MLYRLDGVRVSFGGREVLRGVCLQHEVGEKLALLGRNGCGKTTLLRLIGGEIEPDGGVVERSRAFRVARVEQHLANNAATEVLDFCLGAFEGLLAIEREIAALEGESGRDGEAALERLHELHEAFERCDGYRARPRAEAALQALGVPPDLFHRPLGALSGGERTRVALARALLSPASLLLLDEPTNHLDLLGVDFLSEEMARRDGAVLLITHDRQLVDRLGGAIMELHGGRLERYSAGYDRYRRERAARRAQAYRAWELQRAEILRQEEFIRRNIAGQNTRQAQARQKLLAKMERLEPPPADAPAVKLRWPAAGRCGDRVLEVANLAAGYGEPVLLGVSFVLRRGERLALVGRNGAGKSTLVKTIIGALPALGGSIRFGTGVVPGVYDQESAETASAASVLDSLLHCRPDWAPAEARAWAGRFGFSGEAAEAPAHTMSGGERSRATLARLLAQAPNLLVLDEPTNHLDIPTCEALEEALSEYPGAVLLVSHDRRLLSRVATAALLLEGGRATAWASVSEAFERLGLAAERTAAAPRAGLPAARRSRLEEERRRCKRDAARARQRAEALAAELQAGEEKVAAIEARLCDREVYSDPRRAGALLAEAEELRTHLSELLDAWTDAEEDAEALERALAALLDPEEWASGTGP